MACIHEFSITNSLFSAIRVPSKIYEISIDFHGKLEESIKTMAFYGDFIVPETMEI